MSTTVVLLVVLGDLLLLAGCLVVCGWVVTRLTTKVVAGFAESYRRAQGIDAVVPQLDSEAMGLFTPSDEKIKPPWEEWPDERVQSDREP